MLTNGAWLGYIGGCIDHILHKQKHETFPLSCYDSTFMTRYGQEYYTLPYRNNFLGPTHDQNDGNPLNSRPLSRIAFRSIS